MLYLANAGVTGARAFSDASGSVDVGGRSSLWWRAGPVVVVGNLAVCCVEWPGFCWRVRLWG